MLCRYCSEDSRSRGQHSLGILPFIQDPSELHTPGSNPSEPASKNVFVLFLSDYSATDDQNRIIRPATITMPHESFSTNSYPPNKPPTRAQASILAHVVIQARESVKAAHIARLRALLTSASLAASKLLRPTPRPRAETKIRFLVDTWSVSGSSPMTPYTATNQPKRPTAHPPCSFAI